MRNITQSFPTRDIISGTFSGLLAIVNAVAVTAVIFKGSLSHYFAIGFSCILIGSCLMNLFTASFSNFRYGIARADPALATILAIVFINVFHSHLPADYILPSFLAIFFTSSLVAGLIMYLLGKFQLGHITRFVPYPVLGGIICGTGWLIIQAAFPLIINPNLIFPHLQLSEIMQFASGILLFIILLFTSKNNTQSLLVPVIFFAAALIVNLLLWLGHISHLQAAQSGWLFPPFTTLPVTQFNFLHLFSHVAWGAILSQFYYFLSLTAVVTIILLLNINNLEIIAKNKVSLDHELKVTGLGNIVNALFCGNIAYLSLSGTIINQFAGGTRRISGIVSAIVCGISFLIYPDIISYLPKPLLGGFLLYFAYKLLAEWLIAGWKKLPLIDYLIILLILFTVGFQGFLAGVLVGIITACAVFIVRYTKIDATKFAISGVNFRSNVIRPLHEQTLLHEKGKEILIFKLQGYLFFGSIKLLMEKINSLIEKKSGENLHFLIFDFQLVTGVDISAGFSFIRLQEFTDPAQLQIIFTGLSMQLIQELTEQEVISGNSRAKIFATLDQGMEWCEEQLLRGKKNPHEFSENLNILIPDQKQREIFLKYLQKNHIPADHLLIKQGEKVDCLYFIEQGEVTILLESGEQTQRLSKSGPGTIVGEIGFYLQTKRTATVRTETPCVIYLLTRKSLQELELQHPEIALIFHKNIINVLALRLIRANQELKQLIQ